MRPCEWQYSRHAGWRASEASGGRKKHLRIPWHPLKASSGLRGCSSRARADGRVGRTMREILRLNGPHDDPLMMGSVVAERAALRHDNRSKGPLIAP